MRVPSAVETRQQTNEAKSKPRGRRDPPPDHRERTILLSLSELIAAAARDGGDKIAFPLTSVSNDLFHRCYMPHLYEEEREELIKKLRGLGYGIDLDPADSSHIRILSW